MDKIRVGMVGLGGRGEVNMPRLLMFPDVEITCVCDVYEDRCHNMIKMIEEKGHKAPDFTLDYKEMIARDDVDVVCIFSSWESHVEIALEAMKKGKTTAMEVGGAQSLKECWDLVDTYEKTKTPFMLLENCCYGKSELLVRNMVRDGVFGEIVHCHGAYAHDLRRQVSAGKEERHYRLNHYLNRNCDNYPTHDFGPIAKIIDINRGNRMVSLVSMASKARGMVQYINDRKETIVNRDLIGQSFKQGDVVKTLITCENGEMVSLTLDTTLPRFYSREFTVKGTKGLYEENTNTVFLDGDSEEDYVAVDHMKKAMDNATKFEEKYLPDFWKNITPEQIEGHGGMDYFMFDAFFKAVREKTPMPIDVYDAAAWMAITTLSEQSIKGGNIPMEVPDFTRGAYKTRERLDV